MHQTDKMELHSSFQDGKMWFYYQSANCGCLSMQKGTMFTIKVERNVFSGSTQSTYKLACSMDSMLCYFPYPIVSIHPSVPAPYSARWVFRTRRAAHGCTVINECPSHSRLSRRLRTSGRWAWIEWNQGNVLQRPARAATFSPPALRAGPSHSPLASAAPSAGGWLAGV